MKKLPSLLLCLSALLLNACGLEEKGSEAKADRGTSIAALTFAASAAAAAKPQLWRIHPENNLENCLVPVVYVETNNLVSPPAHSYKYRPDFKACSAPYDLKEYIITNAVGRPWNGENAPVQIQSKNLANQCLYNNGNYHPAAPDKGDLVWIPCSFPGMTMDPIEKERRTFWLKKDQRGNFAIWSEVQLKLGLPNAQVECVEIVGGGARRRPCIGLNMWKFKRQG